MFIFCCPACRGAVARDNITEAALRWRVGVAPEKPQASGVWGAALARHQIAGGNERGSSGRVHQGCNCPPPPRPAAIERDVAADHAPEPAGASGRLRERERLRLARVAFQKGAHDCTVLASVVSQERAARKRAWRSPASLGTPSSAQASHMFRSMSDASMSA